MRVNEFSVLYRYAGVYTAEEAALITKDKLIRLQSLYINQFKRLQHVMREKRRSYLVALGKEREAFGKGTHLDIHHNASCNVCSVKVYPYPKLFFDMGKRYILVIHCTNIQRKGVNK